MHHFPETPSPTQSTSENATHLPKTMKKISLFLMFLEISIRYLEIYILFTLTRINRSQVTFIWHNGICLSSRMTWQSEVCMGVKKMPKTVTAFRRLEPTPYEARPFLRSKGHRKYISGINCKQNNVVYVKFQSPLGNLTLAFIHW